MRSILFVAFFLVFIDAAFLYAEEIVQYCIFRNLCKDMKEFYFSDFEKAVDSLYKKGVVKKSYEGNKKQIAVLGDEIFISCVVGGLGGKNFCLDFEYTKKGKWIFYGSSDRIDDIYAWIEKHLSNEREEISYFGDLDLCRNRGKFVIEGLKDELFSADMRCAFFKAFNISDEHIFRGSEEVDDDLKKNYVVQEYLGNNFWSEIYREFKNDGFVDKREFVCHFVSMEGGNFCADFIYKIDGVEVNFDDSLKGKDEVYDWIVENIWNK